MAQKTFKTPIAQANNMQPKVPLHIKSLQQQTGRNPAYMKMAQYARGDDKEDVDDYFYAFKDAYEQSKDFNKYNLMMPDDISSRLSDRYWKLQDDDYEARGLTPGSYESDRTYERLYQPDFESKYGTHDQFMDKTMNAWKKWMTENFGGYSEEHQTLGRYIKDNPDKFKTSDDLENYFREWGGEPGMDDAYRGYYNFWRRKMFPGSMKGKVGSREFSLDDFIGRIGKSSDRELAREIAAINAANFDMSENEILDYFDKKAGK